MARRIYLDYASTTPLDKAVLKKMAPFMAEHFANPSALYKEALEAKQAVQNARKNISELLNVRSEEIFFTASGTESNNFAVRGVFESVKNRPHFITTNIEHPSILEVLKHLEKQGAEVTYIEVEENGIVDPEKIKKSLKPNTVLVTVMYANNEIGTIQPLRDISRVIEEYKKQKENKNQENNFPYFHTDASQAANYLDLSFQKLGVDIMTLDASKIYGPKGVGLLAKKRHVEITPLIYGGGQEKGMRAGTENVAGIVGMAEALIETQKIREKESVRLRELQEYFFKNVIKNMPGVIINGDTAKRLPNNVNICIPGIDAEFAVIKLDALGIACSAASACLNLKDDTFSYVIDALGESGRSCRSSSLRFTFGRDTIKKEIDLTIEKLRSIIIAQ